MNAFRNLKNVDNMDVLNKLSREENINYEMHLPGVQQNQMKQWAVDNKKNGINENFV